MKFSHLVVVAALALVAETRAEAADSLDLPVVFELERASTVTVVIEDAAGKRVRNLAAAVRLSPGKNLLSWDGYDDGELQKDGSTIRHRVPPGRYRARGITGDGVRLIYEFPVNSPGTPPWFTKERDGAWLADHTSAQSVVVAPASDTGFLGRGQSRLIVSAKTAEAGDAFMALDLNGKKIIGNSDFGWNGAYAMTLDRGPQAPAGDGDPWLYCLLVDKKEVTLNVFSRSGKTGTPFKQTTTAGATWNGGKIGDSVAAWNGIVVISVPHEKVLMVVDPRAKDLAKRLLGRIAQEDPRGVLFDPEGRLLVATARQVKRLTLDFAKATVLREEVVVTQDLEDAQQLTQDKAGNLYVGDWGKQHVVRVFNPAGKLVRTIGKPGGPQLGGSFDNERLHYPKGLAIDEREQLWVVDVDHLPKRITTWSAADGKLLRTFIGGPKYGGGGTLDPQDRTRMYYGIFNGGYAMKLDWAKGTAVVESVYTRPEQWAGQDRDKTIGAMPEDAIHVGANTYLVPNFNGGGGHNPGECTVWLLGKDNVAVPVAVVGGTHFQEASHGGWNPSRNPGVAELFKKMPSTHLMIWSDRNRDGRAQPEEFTSWPTATPYIGQNIRFNADLSFTVRGMAVPAPDFLPNGVPVWPGARAPVAVTGDERPANTLATTDGWVLNVDWGKQRDILGFRNNKRMWDYPSLEGTRIPSKPGTIIMAKRFLGAPFAPKLGEAGMVFGINGEKGSMYLMTTDGLFIQDVGGDMRVSPTIDSKFPKAERGMVVEGVSFHDEHYGPSLSQTKEGDVVLIAGKEFSAVFRVDGLAKIKRREFATFDLDVARLAGLPETQVLPARQQGRLSLSVGIGGVAPRVDGDLADWGPDTAWAKLDDRAGATLRVVGDRLFAAWRTGDAKALSNAPGEPKFIFKRGGAVDLMIAADPKAKPQRLEPAAGDLRLLATLQDGKRTAVLYRAVVPGTPAADRVPFESPVGRVDFDRVEVVSDKIELAQRGGDIELSVPLAVLGMKVGNGTLLHGDLGLLRGNGAMTSQRLYWNNLDTAICSDIPSEARLMPANWGTWRLIPQAMLGRIEATASPKDLVPGLAWRYVEGNWNAATDLSKQPVISSGNAPLPDLKGFKARPENFGVIYEGFIDVPRAGVWTISGMVNDSCRVWVSGLPFVDDTGAAGNGGHDYEGSAMRLSAGLHPLRIEYIQKGGGSGFRLDWTGPEQPKKQIPAAAFKSKP